MQEIERQILLFAILARGYAHIFLERVREIRGGEKGEFVGDLRDRIRGIQ